MDIAYKKRELVKTLPATITLTTASLFPDSDYSAEATLISGGSFCDTSFMLEVDVEGSSAVIGLPEDMAYFAGVWRVCLLEDCEECLCTEVELANDCNLLSIEVDEASAASDYEDTSCQCQ